MCGGWSGVEGVKEAKKTRKICGFDAGISPWGTARLAGDPEHFHKRSQRSPRRPFFSRTPPPTNQPAHHHPPPLLTSLSRANWEEEAGTGAEG